MAAMSLDSLPFSMKAREVRMVSSFAARQAARMLAAPAVKLIIAGTRPADISPRIVTTAPLALGSITPNGLPGPASGVSFAPSTAAAVSSRLYVSAPVTGSSMATWLWPCVCAASDHRLQHGAVGGGGAKDKIGHDAVERRARRLSPFATLQIGITCEPHRLKDCDLHLRKPAAANLRL